MKFNDYLIIAIFLVCNGVWAWAANKNDGGTDLREATIFPIINLTLYQGLISNDPVLFGISFAGLLAAEINKTVQKALKK